MDIKKLKCSNCGADLETSNNVETYECQYCGTKVIVSDSATKVDRILKAVTNATERIQSQSLENQKKQLEFRNSKEYKNEQKIVFFIFFGCIALMFLISVKSLFSEDDKNHYIQIECTRDNKTYLLKVDNEIGLSCAACDEQIISDLNEKYIDIDNLSISRKNIKIYFENSGGTCN